MSKSRDGIDRVYCLVCNKCYQSKDNSPIGFTIRYCCGQETETNQERIDFLVKRASENWMLGYSKRKKPTRIRNIPEYDLRVVDGFIAYLNETGVDVDDFEDKGKSQRMAFVENSKIEYPLPSYMIVGDDE